LELLSDNVALETVGIAVLNPERVEAVMYVLAVRVYVHTGIRPLRLMVPARLAANIPRDMFDLPGRMVGPVMERAAEGK
jgi:hypothetical protein